MKYTKYSLITALALAGMIGLVGCNEDDTSASGVSKTAVVEFGATFPSSGVSKSMIDENTDVINIKLYSGSYGMHPYSTEYTQPVLVADVNVTRTNSTATLTKVPIGDFFANVTSYDANGNELDRLNLGGTLAEGKNTLTATMLRGKWTLDTPITLNKTLSTDTARIDSISIIPNAYLYNYSTKKAALDFSSPLGWTELPMLINGANLPKVSYIGYNPNTYEEEYNVTSTSETRLGGYLQYFNQFKGLSTNTNALHSMEMILKPTSGTVIREDLNNTREAFILGIDPTSGYTMYQEPGFDSNTTFSETGISALATSKATAYNKVSGNIVEMRTKSQTWSEKCYEGNTTSVEVTCPWNQQLSAQKARKKMVTKAIAAKQAKVSKSSYNSSTKCFTDLTVTDNEKYLRYQYDYSTSPYTVTTYTVVGTGTWVGDACVHPFSATGAQLSSDDLNITLQRVR